MSDDALKYVQLVHRMTIYLKFIW